MEDRIQRLSGQALDMAVQINVPAQFFVKALGGLLLAAAALLAAGFGANSAYAATAEDLELEPLVVREPERKEVKIERLDNENFELGGFGGLSHH